MTKRGQNSRRKRRARYRNDREYMRQSFDEFGISDSLLGLAKRVVEAVACRTGLPPLAITVAHILSGPGGQ